MHLKLISNIWIRSDLDLLDITDRIARFFIDEVDFRAPMQSEPNEYSLVSTWDTDGGPVGGELLDIYDQARARDQISGRNVGILKMTFPGHWINGYVSDPIVMAHWAIDFFIIPPRVSQEPFEIRLAFDHADEWFANDKYAVKLYEKWGSGIKGYIESGYSLRPSGAPLDKWGQGYIPFQSNNEKNRTKVIRGISAFAREFNSLAFLVSYGRSGSLDTKRMMLRFSMGADKLLPIACYAGEASPPEDIEKNREEYMPIYVQGLEVLVRTDHYSHLGA